MDAAELSQLVKNIRTGDESAVGKIVQSELPRLYALCHRLTHNTAEAEELAHQAFTKAIGSIRKCKEDTLFTDWLHRAAISVWMESVRARKVPRTTHHESDILNALDKLDPEDKAILVLRDMEGRSIEDVGRVLAISAASAQARVSRARAHLRETSRRLKGSLV